MNLSESMLELKTEIEKHTNGKKVENIELFNLKRFNDAVDSNGVIDCEECKGKGIVAFIDENAKCCYKECKCSPLRRARMNLKKLGLLKYVDKNCSFDSFVTKEKFQVAMKQKAMNYVDNYEGKWFFIGGSVGVGKTKLCTTIFSKIIEKEKTSDVEYFRWDANYKDLCFNKYGEENGKLERLRECKILYLDDFMRNGALDDFARMERTVAKDIISYRYDNELVTIISSELNCNEIEELDESIGTRIYQMAKDNICNIARSKDRNVRKHEELV